MNPAKRNSFKFTSFGSLFHLMVGMSFSGLAGFGNPILTFIGLDSSQIGIVFALAMLLGIALQMLLSVLIENYKIITIIQSYQIECILTTFFLIGAFYFKDIQVVSAIMFMLALAVSISWFPTLSALTIDCINAGIDINFGLSRAFGSIGYSLLAVIGGMLVQSFGIGVLVKTSIGINMVMLILSFTYPRYTNTVEHLNQEGDTILGLLKKNKKFRRIIIGISLIFFAHNIINMFMKNITDSVGATEFQYGYLMGIGSFLELPTMLLFVYLIKRYKSLILLKISAIFMTVKVVIQLLAVDYIGILISQLIQPLAFALFAPAIVFFMNEIVARKNQVKAQLMVGVACMGIGGGLGNFVGGILIKSTGIHTTLIITIMVSLIGTIMYLSIKEK